MSVHTYFLYVTCLVTTCHALAQKSILRNGGFEEHGDQKCLSCYQSSGQFAALVYHWDNGGWHCMLCDKDYRQQSDDRKGKLCPLDRVSPQSGKAMISMVYSPGVNGIYGGVEGASHLSARTTEPMRVGQLYEVSLWLYVDSTKRQDPDWGKHLGIALLPQNLSFFGGRKSLVIPFLAVDTLVYDRWYEVKWRVRPLCTSNYLMIGVFADPQWPKTRSYADVHYYLDNVSLVEMPEASAISDSSVYYCSRYDPVLLGVQPLMDSKMLWYENEEFKLTDEHRAVLDSFAEYANRYPDLVFEISGHTDSLGKDNFNLSQKRAQAVSDYLIKTLQLPPYRFYALALGATAPFRPNYTEEGRKMNRRAAIRQSELTLPMMYYRYALKAVERKKKPEAFVYLDKWTATAEKGALMLLLFDPRFDPLRSDKRWPIIEQKVRGSYQNLNYGKESFRIDSLRFDACRFSGGALAALLNGLQGNIPGSENYFVEFPGTTEVAAQYRYQAHFDAILPILKKTGWPKKGSFSESAVNNAFHLLLNSGDVAAYLEWLPALQQACEAGDIPWMMFATCYDKCMVGLGKPQRYLTDYQMLEGGGLQQPLKWEGDENTVNDFRAKIGLPLLPQDVVDAMKKNK
ncbi:MAG: OmpA family protein [Lewinellaceae bacterium]|nr:OmpA family protein [Lewinellaceae bacterium]